MRVASFNINSARLRETSFKDWLRAQNPSLDVVLLQEIKCTQEQFPSFSDCCYRAAINGQKSYNGVAILVRSALDFEVRASSLPGATLAEIERDQPRWPGASESEPNEPRWWADLTEPYAEGRYLEIEMASGEIIASIYAPNGNPVSNRAKFGYKLHFMRRLATRMRDDLLPRRCPLILGGDLNVCPENRDCFDSIDMAEDALLHEESRQNFFALRWLGFIDAFRHLHAEADDAHGWTFWDYQQARRKRGQGMRIDFFLLNGRAADRLEACQVDESPRDGASPSDHTPLVLSLAPPRSASILDANQSENPAPHSNTEPTPSIPATDKNTSIPATDKNTSLQPQFDF